MQIQKSQQTMVDLQNNEQDIVQIKDLVKRYGSYTAVDNLNLSIRKGEIFGLLGPNGAGKTTTLEIVEGVRAQDSGEVTVMGLDVRRHRRQIQRQIGVQLQATTLFPHLTVRETIALFASFYPHHIPVDQLLKQVDLVEKARTYPQNLSGGQRQRLALALALVNDPMLVFLDEPTTGLDPQSRRALWESIERLRSEGKTIILTTHFMDEAQRLCDRIAIVDAGRIIAQGTTPQLLEMLGASSTIVCTLGEGTDGTAITEAQLNALPGVISTRLGLEQTHIYSENAEQTLMALFQLVARQGASLNHVQLQSPTLEDVFLKLTGRNLRD